MVNKEALRSPPDAVPFEQMADNSGGDNSSGDTFNDRTHATDAGAAFNTTRIMTVPDRIVLAGKLSSQLTARDCFKLSERYTSLKHIVMFNVYAGSEQHYELPGRPRELELDDQIYNNWSPSRIPISIQTPPRRLTLHDHSYPTADSEDYEDDATLQRQTSSGRQQQFNGSVANQLVGTTGDADDSEQQFLFYQGGTPSATPKGLRERWVVQHVARGLCHAAQTDIFNAH